MIILGDPAVTHSYDTWTVDGDRPQANTTIEDDRLTCGSTVIQQG
jgi:hypothetical protein